MSHETSDLVPSPDLSSVVKLAEWSDVRALRLVIESSLEWVELGLWDVACSHRYDVRLWNTRLLRESLDGATSISLMSVVVVAL